MLCYVTRQSSVDLKVFVVAKFVVLVERLAIISGLLRQSIFNICGPCDDLRARGCYLQARFVAGARILVLVPRGRLDLLFIHTSFQSSVAKWANNWRLMRNDVFVCPLGHTGIDMGSAPVMFQIVQCRKIQYGISLMAAATCKMTSPNWRFVDAQGPASALFRRHVPSPASGLW